jgi:hypothetical protein
MCGGINEVRQLLDVVTGHNEGAPSSADYISDLDVYVKRKGVE